MTVQSTKAAEVIGISYRRLDYLTRVGAIPGMTTGSGNYRTWDERIVIRLALANHLVSHMPAPSANAPFPDIAAAALDPRLPDPPRCGYGCVTHPFTVTWAATWADVRRLAISHGAVTVVSYNLDEIVGDAVDLDRLLPPTD